MSIEEKYVYTTAEESILDKDWAAGSPKQNETKEYIIRKIGTQYVGQYTTVKYAPAWLKIIDEPLVNAIDHIIRCFGTAHPVTEIRVDFEPSGRVRIYNNGPGIEITIHMAASEKLGRTIYVPTMLFEILFQGSNRKRAEDCIIGGTNGLGGKLSNVFAIEFALETVDGVNYFVQKWEDHKSKTSGPTIIPLANGAIPKERAEQHTTLAFTPDYKIFGYETFTQKDYESLIDIVRTRVIFASAYAHFATAGRQPMVVKFNGETLNFKSIEDIAKVLFPNHIMMNVRATPGPSKSYRYPWDVCAIISSTTGQDNPPSIVNGIMVKNGKHVRKIMNLITEGVEAKIAKLFNDKSLKFSPSYITNNVFLLMNTQIPNPAWTGQRKDELDTDIRKFAHYSLDAKFITAMADKLKDQILASMFDNAPKAKKKKSTIVDYEKYKPATNAGKKGSLKCGLIFCEGDSAMRRLETGIAATIGWQDYGIISTGGVIVNARKECTVVETLTGKHIKQSTKLANNVFLNAFFNILGLNPLHKYDPDSPTYKKEIQQLNYGHIIGGVDQDLDGKGNILALVLNNIAMLFPNLLKAGFVKWLSTPIIRLYPKAGGKVIEFHSIAEFDIWCKANDVSKYNPRYYKGIGSHSKEEAVQMFKTFHQNLITYTVDPRTNELCEIYFGLDPDKRKVELSRPSRILSTDEVLAQRQTRQISVSDHFEIEANAYQKDNLDRKLDHIADGYNQSGRKIRDGLQKSMGSGKEMRVEQMSGYISEHEFYHHGGASLEASITGYGLITPGGKQLPIIIPLSNFGSRKEGGHDASSPRYIRAIMNTPLTNALDPPIDYWILPFNFEEGQRAEPKYYAPIIPTVICESTEIPAHGWKLVLWARDVFKVIENVRRLILCRDDLPLPAMPPCTYAGSQYAWTGTFKHIRGKLYSFGRYSYDPAQNVIVITELPLRVWTVSYVKALKAKAKTDAIIADGDDAIFDLADDTKISITIQLLPGAIDVLETMGDGVYTDGIEEYFLLRKSMDSLINLTGFNGEVVEFKTYEDVIYPWFQMRKRVYAERVYRAIILQELLIGYLENIIRYIELTTAMNMPKRKVAEMEKILAENGFTKYHHGKITKPKFVPTDDLMTVIMAGKKATYNYLLDMSDRKKSEESLANYKKQLAEAQAQLLSMRVKAAEGRFPGAAIWIDELNTLENVIREGHRTNWLYGNAGKYHFD